MLQMRYFGEFQGVSYGMITCACPRACSSQPASALSSEMGCMAGDGYLQGGGRELDGSAAQRKSWGFVH